MKINELISNIKKYTFKNFPNITIINKKDVQKVFNFVIQYMYENMTDSIISDNGSPYLAYRNIVFKDKNNMVDITISRTEEFISITMYPSFKSAILTVPKYKVYILHEPELSDHEWILNKKFKELVENLPKDEYKAWLYLNGIGTW